MPEEAKLTPAERARQQAEAYGSVLAGTTLELTYTDGRAPETIHIPPPPSWMIFPGPDGDERLSAYLKLQEEIKSCDREDDIVLPAEKDEKTGEVTPSTTIRGKVMYPYKKDGELLDPPYEVRLVKTVIGDDTYAKLKAAGKSAGDVQAIWMKQSFELRVREAVDPK